MAAQATRYAFRTAVLVSIGVVIYTTLAAVAVLVPLTR